MIVQYSSRWKRLILYSMLPSTYEKKRNYNLKRTKRTTRSKANAAPGTNERNYSVSCWCRYVSRSKKPSSKNFVPHKNYRYAKKIAKKEIIVQRRKGDPRCVPNNCTTDTHWQFCFSGRNFSVAFSRRMGLCHTAKFRHLSLSEYFIFAPKGINKCLIVLCKISIFIKGFPAMLRFIVQPYTTVFRATNNVVVLVTRDHLYHTEPANNTLLLSVIDKQHEAFDPTST